MEGSSTVEAPGAACHVKRINDANPDNVWVGMGAPKQDLWVAEHSSRLRAPQQPWYPANGFSSTAAGIANCRLR